MGKLSKEEVAMVGFEIVSFAGEARSELMTALSLAKEKKFSEVEKLIIKADEALSLAHQSQTDMLAAEARGESTDVGFIMVHAQDHLMTTLLLKDLVHHFIELYKQQII